LRSVSTDVLRDIGNCATATLYVRVNISCCNTIWKRPHVFCARIAPNWSNRPKPPLSYKRFRWRSAAIVYFRKRRLQRPCPTRSVINGHVHRVVLQTARMPCRKDDPKRASATFDVQSHRDLWRLRARRRFAAISFLPLIQQTARHRFLRNSPAGLSSAPLFCHPILPHVLGRLRATPSTAYAPHSRGRSPAEAREAIQPSSPPYWGSDRAPPEVFLEVVKRAPERRARVMPRRQNPRALTMPRTRLATQG
jgi:hypothetical protein